MGTDLRVAHLSNATQGMPDLHAHNSVCPVLDVNTEGTVTQIFCRAFGISLFWLTIVDQIHVILKALFQA